MGRAARQHSAAGIQAAGIRNQLCPYTPGQVMIAPYADVDELQALPAGAETEQIGAGVHFLAPRLSGEVK
jgi:hypothetical protein